MKGWSNAVSVSYTGGGIQLITIHRAAGTAYTETVGTYTVWHLYIGANSCKADYADIRFTTPSGADITHYRRPGYTSSAGTFEVALPATGPVHVWYGNPSATTASAGSTLIPGITSFTSTGSTTYTVPTGVTSVEVLVVAGGGGGGQGYSSTGGSGGGGGAGGVLNPFVAVTPGSSVSVTVGGGGAALGGNGGNSKFGGQTAIGGGGGGSGGLRTDGINYWATPGKSGGSGGGGGGEGVPEGQGTPPGASGGAGTAGQGTDGATGQTYRGGKQGGAGGGLKYTSSISGASVIYGTGGGGGGQTSGAPNTGNGGGGAKGSGTAGAGGSGIVVVKPYPSAGNIISVDPVSITTSFTGILLGSANMMVV